MKNVLKICLVVTPILLSGIHNQTQAALEATKPESGLSKSDTTQTWVVQITPAPGVDSYATRKISFDLVDGPVLTSTSNKANSIEIVPREIPIVASKSECSNCNQLMHRATRPIVYQRRYPIYRNSFPWLQNYAYFNPYSAPAFYMYTDFIRSDWYGSPYRGNYFYYQGYRPSFRFGSLQFRGFGAYDRMYNPRIIPFGYQYTGSRTYYANLALTAMYPSYPW